MFDNVLPWLYDFHTHHQLCRAGVVESIFHINVCQCIALTVWLPHTSPVMQSRYCLSIFHINVCQCIALAVWLPHTSPVMQSWCCWKHISYKCLSMYCLGCMTSTHITSYAELVLFNAYFIEMFVNVLPWLYDFHTHHQLCRAGVVESIFHINVCQCIA